MNPHSLTAQLVKNLSAMQETLVRFLGQEDLLEKGSYRQILLVWWKGVSPQRDLDNSSLVNLI